MRSISTCGELSRVSGSNFSISTSGFGRSDRGKMLTSSLALSDSKGTSHTVVPLARQPGIEESKTGGGESGDESVKGSISYSNSGVSPLPSAVRTDSSEALITISRFSTAPNNAPWPTPPNFPSLRALKKMATALHSSHLRKSQYGFEIGATTKYTRIVRTRIFQKSDGAKCAT